MKIHDLKCWPEYFKAILDGKKRFEQRIDDRGFAVGDILHLREWDPTVIDADGNVPYTGRSFFVVIDYIFKNDLVDKTDVVIMSVSDPFSVELQPGPFNFSPSLEDEGKIRQQINQEIGIKFKRREDLVEEFYKLKEEKKD